MKIGITKEEVFQDVYRGGVVAVRDEGHGVVEVGHADEIVLYLFFIQIGFHAKTNDAKRQGNFLIYLCPFIFEIGFLLILFPVLLFHILVIFLTVSFGELSVLF